VREKRKFAVRFV